MTNDQLIQGKAFTHISPGNLSNRFLGGRKTDYGTALYRPVIFNCKLNLPCLLPKQFVAMLTERAA